MLGLPSLHYFRQYAIVASVNLGVLSIGLMLSWSSPVLLKLKNQNETCLLEPVTDYDASWIVSGGFLTSIVAMFLPPLLMDRIGRKPSLVLAQVPHIVASIMFIVATEPWLLIFGRVLTGISLSMLFSVTPTYIAEIASKETRGALGATLQVASCTGILIMYSVGPFVSYRTLSIIYATLVIVTAIPSLFLPESPYFLYSKGKTDEALSILKRLRDSELSANQEIEEYELAKNDKKLEKSVLLKDAVFLKTVAIVMVFGILGHCSGASAIIYYMQGILESTKSTVSSDVASAVVGVIKIVAVVLSALFNDKFGRKPILIWTWFGKVIGMGGLGTYFYTKTEAESSAFVNYIPLLCIILVIFCHNAGQNPLFFVVVSELFEGPSRAIGVTSGIFTSLFINFLLAMYLSQLLTKAGPSVTYWSFGVISALAVVFINIFLPETKGESFAAIQEKLGRRRKKTTEENL